MSTEEILSTKEILTEEKGGFSAWVWGGVSGSIRSNTVGAMTNLMFQYGPLHYLSKSIFGRILPHPTPAYMIELQKIEQQLEEMNAKLDTLLSFSEAILSQINKTYNYLVETTTLKELHSREATPYIIHEKFIKLGKLDAFQRYYTLDSLWKYATGTCQLIDGQWQCNTLEQALILELGGQPPESSLPLSGTTIQDLYSILKMELEDPTGHFTQLNKDIKTHLGVTYQNGKLVNVQLPDNTTDVTTPWNAVNTALNNLSLTYYNALSELYYMQALQLAFYYAHPNFFQNGFVITDTNWIKGTDPKKDGKEGFAIALDRMTSSFSVGEGGLGKAIKNIFGTDLGKSVVKNNIPSLKDYVQYAVNNGHIFPDTLLETCAIKSVYMPTVTSDKKEYFLGRIEMIAFSEKEGITQQITVGHDIPYASLPLGSRTRIGNTGIDGFRLEGSGEDTILSAIKYSKKDYNKWMPSYDIEKDSIPTIMGMSQNSGKTKSRAYYQAYQINLPNPMKFDYEWTTKFESVNAWSRKSLGKLNPDKNRLKYDKYESDWFGKGHKTSAFSQSYLIVVKRTGTLLFLQNAFTAVQIYLNDQYTYYIQFVKPLPFNYASPDVVTTRPLELSNPFHKGFLVNEKNKEYKGNINRVITFEATQTPISLKLDLKTTNVWEKGKANYEKSTAVSTIDIKISNVPQNYLFSATKAYKAWVEEDKKYPATHGYLNGGLSINRSEVKDTIILQSSSEKNAETWTLVYTTKGTLVLQSAAATTLLFDGAAGDVLSFSNGDIFLDRVGVLAAAYERQKRKLRWVVDPFALLSLSPEGVLEVTCSSTPLLGDEGVIWSSDWKDGHWPEVSN